MTRATNRTHARQIALASYATRHPYAPPAYYAAAEELDHLEAQATLTEIETDRRIWLRAMREAGMIGDAGERWEAELARSGYLPVRCVGMMGE